MKKIFFIIALSLVSCRYCIAQTKDEDTEIEISCVVLQNGTMISTKCNNENKVLTFDIHNNPEEVEIVVVKNGVTIESESSNTEDDNINLDLSKYKDCTVEIYVRNRRESQYVGNVDCKSEK